MRPRTVISAPQAGQATLSSGSRSEISTSASQTAQAWIGERGEYSGGKPGGMSIVTESEDKLIANAFQASLVHRPGSFSRPRHRPRSTHYSAGRMTVRSALYWLRRVSVSVPV